MIAQPVESTATPVAVLGHKSLSSIILSLSVSTITTTSQPLASTVAPTGVFAQLSKISSTPSPSESVMITSPPPVQTISSMAISKGPVGN